MRLRDLTLETFLSRYDSNEFILSLNYRLLTNLINYDSSSKVINVHNRATAFVLYKLHQILNSHCAFCFVVENRR